MISLSDSPACQEYRTSLSAGPAYGAMCKKTAKGKGPAPGTSGVTFPQSLQLHTLLGLPIRKSFYPCLTAEHSSLSPSMLT